MVKVVVAEPTNQVTVTTSREETQKRHRNLLFAYNHGTMTGIIAAIFENDAKIGKPVEVAHEVGNWPYARPAKSRWQ